MTVAEQPGAETTTRDAERSGARWRMPSAAWLLLLPAVMVVYMSFRSGGFFAGTPAFVAFVAGQVLIARLLVAERPLSGASTWLAVGGGLLAGFALWTLISGSWSHSAGRAFVEFDRAFLYALVLVLVGSIGRTERRVRGFLWALTAAIVTVSACALVTRLLPHLWPTASNIANNRLSYPLSYANALGILAGFGVVLAVSLACDERQPRLARALGAAATPVVACTVFFTFSRGSIASVAVGLVAYLLLARPRGFLAALVGAGAPTAVALVSSYHANLLSTVTPTTAAARNQGHHVAVVVALAVVAAFVIRLALTALDTRLVAVRLPRESRRAIVGGAWAAGVVVVVVVALAAGVPGTVSHQYHNFVHNSIGTQANFRDRLTVLDNGYRIKFWQSTLKGADASTLHGTGAGTTQILWNHNRSVYFNLVNAHSLYVQSLGELGIVGLFLVAGFVLLVLARTAMLARGPTRSLYAALFAVALTWALHAGFDWDWEMPAVTVVFFAVAGVALSSPPGPGRLADRWRVVAGLCLLVALVAPTLGFISQARTDHATRALAAGRCGTAAQQARSSLSLMTLRPEPYEVLAACDIKSGSGQLAIDAMRRAVSKDPQSWEPHYLLAAAQATAGQDPLPEAVTARRMNPLEPLVLTALTRYRHVGRHGWVAAGTTALDQALASNELSIAPPLS